MSSIELYHVHFQVLLLIVHCFLTKAAFIFASNRVACHLNRYCLLKSANEALLQYLKLIAATVILFVVPLELRM